MTVVLDHLRALDPGARDRGKIVVGELASGGTIALPYLVARGTASGPCLWVNGNVHGDEVNGVLAAIRFHQRLDTSVLRGSVVVTPTANPLAFDARRKPTPQDGQDLDQTFPGHASGLLSDRIAAVLFGEMRSCADMLVSLHAMGWIAAARPYGVYKVAPHGAVSEDTLLHCLAGFEPVVACRMSVEPGQGELPGNIPGAVDYQFLALGRPAIMIEIGTARQLQVEYVEQTVQGLFRLARLLEMLPGPVSPAGWPLRRVTRRMHATCTHAGLFHSNVVPGELVHAGRVIGDVTNLYGDVVEQVRFERDVIVISVRREPVVHTGDRVAFVGTEWDDVHPARRPA